MTLVERAGRRPVLTAAGAAFQREAAGGLTQLGQATQSARLAAEGKLGVVRIGFVSTVGARIGHCPVGVSQKFVAQGPSAKSSSRKDLRR